ncbi:MAG: vitamin K epoxide reductase family protein [Acidobacteriota bacterium]|jgi:uncharacterized membrane protein
MTSRSRWLILAFALVGLGFASASTQVHYRLLTEPGYVSVCDINTSVNCSQAYLSSYGSLFGVPVALGGVAWFALIALIAAFATTPAPAPAKKRKGTAESTVRPVATYIFGLSLIALCAILYLGYASLFVLQTYCVLCLGTYVCVLGILVTSGMSQTMSLAQVPGRLASDLTAVFKQPTTRVAALVYLAVIVFALVWFPQESSPADAAAAAAAPPPPADALSDAERARFASAWARQPRADLNVDPGTAKVVVVKFNDWLCPGCKQMEEIYAPVLAKYEREQPGAVKYVIKDLPWNPLCNVSIAQPLRGHEAACDAAVAVRVARDEGRPQEMIDWLFANQQRLAEQGMAGGGAANEAIRQKTAELFGVTDFDAAYAAKVPLIRADTEDAVRLDVGSTPTYFVDGVRTTTVRTANDPGGQNLPPEYFDLAIQLALEQAGTSGG